jgi:hypothetical protein
MNAHAEQCLALFWLHLVTLGPQGQGTEHSFHALFTLPARLPRKSASARFLIS